MSLQCIWYYQSDFLLIYRDSEHISSMLKTLQQLHRGSVQMQTIHTGQIDHLVRSLDSLKLQTDSEFTHVGLDHLCQCLSSSERAATQLSKEQAVLRSLSFRSMTARQSSIVEAYSKTYEWIFRSSQLPLSDARSRIKFVEWLQSPERIYWVSGKAGSGKSTLMKFLYENSTTHQMLRYWTGNSVLITAPFYFWNPGTAMQKSQQGLLRSLLFKVLCQCPEWIPIICPDRFKSLDRFNYSAESWEIKELSAAFKRLKAQSFMRTNFCFFIDGLDEYEGDHADLIEILQDMSESPNIKLCLSSRPWPCFEFAFGQNLDHKLYMQDLTRDDIAHFARGRLEDHYTAAALRSNGLAYEDLIQQVVNKAQGVFLWVFLVVRSLREGLSNGDGISMLQKRLRSLPSDLEALFHRMLNSVDKVYKHRMAVTFKVALESDGPLPMIFCSFLEEEDLDLDFAVNLPSLPLSAAQIISRKEVLRRRLSGSYKGLLEIFGDSNNDVQQYYVGFLHRTVRDFLMLKEIRHLLGELLEGKIQPTALVCRALLSQIKTTPITTANCVRELPEEYYKFMTAARQLESESNEADVVVIDELFRTIIRIGYFGLGSSVPAFMVRNAIHARLTLYVTKKIEETPDLIHVDPPLLMSALTAQDGTTEIVQLLLKHGASPNQTFESSIVFDRFLKTYPYSAEREERSRWRRYLRMLLLHGVDINETSGWCGFLLHTLEYTRFMDLWRNDILNDTFGIVNLFFEQGASPNRSPSDSTQTAWERFLLAAFDVSNCAFGIQGRAMKYSAFVISLFLRHGADPQLAVRHEDRRRTVLETINKIFAHDTTSVYLPTLLDLLRIKTERSGAHHRYHADMASPDGQEQYPSHIPYSPSPHPPTSQVELEYYNGPVFPPDYHNHVSRSSLGVGPTPTDPFDDVREDRRRSSSGSVILGNVRIAKSSQSHGSNQKRDFRRLSARPPTRPGDSLLNYLIVPVRDGQHQSRVIEVKDTSASVSSSGSALKLPKRESWTDEFDTEISIHWDYSTRLAYLSPRHTQEQRHSGTPSLV